MVRSTWCVPIAETHHPPPDWFENAVRSDKCLGVKRGSRVKVAKRRAQ